MKPKVAGLWILTLSIVSFVPAQIQTLPSPSPNNTLLGCEQSQGFQRLFDGTLANFKGNFANWITGNDTNTNIDTGWKYCAADSAICTNGKMTASLRSRIKYTDIDLRLDYRDDGDAGIFYRGLNRGTVWYTVPVEYALDDRTTNVIKDNEQAGSAYKLMAASPKVYQTYASGKWNSVRIVVKGDSVEHWLNNTKVLGYRYWNQRFIDSTKYFQTGKDFAQLTSNCKCTIPSGYIGFQGDHPTNWHLRNLRIDTNSVNVNFGPAICSSTAIRETAPSKNPSYSFELTHRVLRVHLRNAIATRAEIIDLNGDFAARTSIESNGNEIQIQGWRSPGLYLLRISNGDVKTERIVKVFLP